MFTCADREKQLRGSETYSVFAFESFLSSATEKSFNKGSDSDRDLSEDEIEAQACKFPRVGNGRNDSTTEIGSSRGSEQYQDEEEDGDQRRRGVGGGGGSDGSTNHFQSSWHHSSRIIRVSRASGGKDRHSKVMTSKGLRDRRVRLSVNTAIQFYDLQDRLGYDQPSKAVEWLIKAASDAISELPSLNNPFPDTPKQPSDEKRSTDQQQQQQGFYDADEDTNYQHNQSQNNLSLSKSACSSTSDTSKGSGLSLSRPEIRVKARERARERTAKEKEKEKEKENENKNNESSIAHHHHYQKVNRPMSHTASFTELLTGGIGSTTVTIVPTTTSPNGSSIHEIHEGNEANLFNKGTNRHQHQQHQHWSSTMDYFSSGLLVGPSRCSEQQQSSSCGFSGHHALPLSAFNGENHSDQMQHFSFMPEHLIPAVVTTSSSSSQHTGNEYNLNVSISSGLAGYNRGTLQSNSPPSLLPHLQRFQPLDGSSNLPFFIGAAPVHPHTHAPPTIDHNNNNHPQLPFSPVFDARLQLCYGDGNRHSTDQKGNGKN
ncbi:hypothetical protein RJT34_13990 [Clitoria ternatea]|uniref:Transcription factor TCP2 n=1 Tax=Clitoria ternatea TaxID=43366 RepID=A0AAN9JS35_CLITE